MDLLDVEDNHNHHHNQFQISSVLFCVVQPKQILLKKKEELTMKMLLQVEREHVPQQCHLQSMDRVDFDEQVEM